MGDHGQVAPLRCLCFPIRRTLLPTLPALSGACEQPRPCMTVHTQTQSPLCSPSCFARKAQKRQCLSPFSWPRGGRGCMKSSSCSPHNTWARAPADSAVHTGGAEGLGCSWRSRAPFSRAGRQERQAQSREARGLGGGRRQRPRGLPLNTTTCSQPLLRPRCFLDPSKLWKATDPVSWHAVRQSPSPLYACQPPAWSTLMVLLLLSGAFQHGRGASLLSVPPGQRRRA